MCPDIFVQIPAYRDSELLPTLRDLVRHTSRPQRLRLAVAWQYGPDERGLESEIRALPFGGLDLIAIAAEQSQGCNWARSLLQQRWRGERYTLILDSHHRFVPRWDLLTVEMYECLRARGVAKPVLTAYLPPYDPVSDEREQVLMRIRPRERVDGMLFRLCGEPFTRSPGISRTSEAPVPAHFVSLHFLFADGRFNDEIAFDPTIYFFADEVAIALRAYTYAWDLFHPHRLLGWHLYDRRTRVPHWADHGDWRTLQHRSLIRLRELFSGRLRGRGGIGECRPLAGYEAMIGTALIEAPR